MGKSEYGPHRFSVKDTALLLGISTSYLGTLEHEHAMIARRTERGKPFYTASDIAILREMGVGKRPRRLRPPGQAILRFGKNAAFGGREPPESTARPMEERELERLRAIQEEARRQREKEWSEEAAIQKAREWRAQAEQRTREWRANKKESPGDAEPVEEAPEGPEPRPAAGDAHAATEAPERRSWWRRVLGG